MNSNAENKKKCITCTKNGGILTCNGCEQVFCNTHAIEHRENLAKELDYIIQEHDSIQNEIQQISTDHALFKQIDQWEKDSITKIKSTAETARKTLETLINQSKENLSKVCHDIGVDLISSVDTQDYLENDFNRWTEQLNKLKSEIIWPSSINIIENKKPGIHLIRVENIEKKKNELSSPSQQQQQQQQKPPLKIEVQEKIKSTFLDVLGPAKLEDKRHVARHLGKIDQYSYIRGNLLYRQGQNSIRIRLEKYTEPYYIFFGCIASKATIVKKVLKLPCVVGWCGFDQVYKHGICTSNRKKYKYISSLIQTNHTLRITFDCEKHQIILYNEDLKTTSVLPIDINLVPLPWQLLVVMYYRNDRIRILNDS